MKGVRRAVVEDGVLTTWLLDWRSARQLNLASTGHASRGTGGPPSPSPTNLWLEPGAVTPTGVCRSEKPARTPPGPTAPTASTPG